MKSIDSIDYDTASVMLWDEWFSGNKRNLGYVCLDILTSHGMDQTTCDQLIIDAWHLTECPNDHREVWDTLWEDYYLLRLKDQQDAIQSKILPNTKIYRGGSQHGRSWTLDINVAQKFYDRKKYLNDPTDKVWEKIIQPKDVLAYINDHEIDGLPESEVVLKTESP